jgi:hypothetical protein
MHILSYLNTIHPDGADVTMIERAIAERGLQVSPAVLHSQLYCLKLDDLVCVTARSCPGRLRLVPLVSITPMGMSYLKQQAKGPPSMKSALKRQEAEEFVTMMLATGAAHGSDPGVADLAERG